MGGWDPDWISEDWHMFLKCFLNTGGEVSVSGIFLPVVNYTPEDSTYVKVRPSAALCFFSPPPHLLRLRLLLLLLLILILVLILLLHQTSGRGAPRSGHGCGPVSRSARNTLTPPTARPVLQSLVARWEQSKRHALGISEVSRPANGLGLGYIYGISEVSRPRRDTMSAGPLCGRIGVAAGVRRHHRPN